MGVDIGTRSASCSEQGPAAQPTDALLAAIAGLLTGTRGGRVRMAGWLGLLARVERAPLAAQLVLPGVGLAASALLLRWLAGGSTPSTSEEYIKSFHERERRLPSAAGAAAGWPPHGDARFGAPWASRGRRSTSARRSASGLQRRLSRARSRDDDAKVLLVAGAAAGVAAIFKAPATGAGVRVGGALPGRPGPPHAAAGPVSAPPPATSCSSPSTAPHRCSRSPGPHRSVSPTSPAPRCSG